MTSLKSHVIYVKEIILVGDFNINWDKNVDRRTLKPITDNCSLTQFIDKPTRITDRSKTKIDLLFTNRPERINIYNLLTEISSVENFLKSDFKVHFTIHRLTGQ